MFRRSLLSALPLIVAAARTARAQPVWRVGINPQGAPFSFRDPQSGADGGVSVELIALIAKQAGVSVQFVPFGFADLIPALTAGRIDVIAANVLATPQRAAIVAFSDTVAKGGDGLVVPITDTRAYRSMQDLAGLPAGSQSGSPFAEAMKRSGLFPQLTIYPTGADAMRAVSQGEIKAAIIGANGAAYEIKRGRFTDLRLVGTYQPLVDSVDAFAVRKDDAERLRMINEGLGRLRADGTLRAILEKYGQPG